MTGDALMDFRRRKDAHFASGQGPIKGEGLRAFHGLSYYPPDPALVFHLPAKPIAGEEVTLQTSSGEPRQMQAYAQVVVPFPAGTHTLTLYAQPGEDTPTRLFLPFRDATSGPETYGAGRYLDVSVQSTEGEPWVLLDFNLAYHPYCAYGDGWTCPLPPAANWIPGVVRAGERLPEA